MYVYMICVDGEMLLFFSAVACACIYDTVHTYDRGGASQSIIHLLEVEPRLLGPFRRPVYHGVLPVEVAQLSPHRLGALHHLLLSFIQMPRARCQVSGATCKK